MASCSSVLREIWTVAFAWDEELRIQPEDHHQIELKSILLYIMKCILKCCAAFNASAINSTGNNTTDETAIIPYQISQTFRPFTRIDS